MLGSLLNMASPASAEEKDDFITTLGKWTKAGSDDMKVYLKVVYAQTVKHHTQYGERHKVVGKLVDLDGTALYFESRGKTPEQCMKPVQLLTTGAVVLAKKLNINTDHKFYGGRFADFGEKGCRTSFQVVPQAHQAHISLRGVFPVANSNLKKLLPYTHNYQRVDIIGLVMSVEEPPLKTGAAKIHLWLKDESNDQLLVNVWGITLVDKARQVQRGDVVQVDNVILTKSAGTSVSASAEDGGDSKHGFCAWLHTKPTGDRVERLKQLSTTDEGNKISDPWQGSLSKGTSLRQETNKGEAIVTCCSTAAACSAAASALPLVEVALCGVWLTAVKGTEVAYLACKHCRTKIDPETGRCKKAVAEKPCVTEPEQEKTILATVTISDATGRLENLLVNGPALKELTDFNSEEELLQATDSYGTQCLCFRTRCDVRLGTAPARVQWRPPSSSASQPSATPASQLSDGTDGPPTQDCQFEIVHAIPRLVAQFDEKDRPCVKKIMRLMVLWLPLGIYLF